jgi:hypothetical protein
MLGNDCRVHYQIFHDYFIDLSSYNKKYFFGEVY